MSIKRPITVWFVVQSALLTQAAFPQCENKTGFAKQVCLVQNANSNTTLGPSSQSALNPPALTTSFADTIHPDTLPATVEPKAFVPLTRLERTDDGAFIQVSGDRHGRQRLLRQARRPRAGGSLSCNSAKQSVLRNLRAYERSEGQLYLQSA